MKKFLILMSILALSIPAYAASFPDVDEADTYYEAIEFLFTEGIISGNNDGTYAPDRVLNRAELMKVIAEGAATYFGWAEGTFDLYTNSNCFDDVPAGEWYTKYICYGKEMGWVVGYENGTLFKPSQDVTFTEGLKITYMGFGLDYSEEGETWYQDSVEYASMNNYIPYTITAFDEGFQRDAMADLLTRIIKHNVGVLDEYLGDRADIVVTYDTIEAGENLSELVEEEVAVEEEEEEEEVVEEEEEEEETAPTTHTISIDDFAFADGSMTIALGDSITWTNDDSAAHTVDIDGFDASGTIASDDSFSLTFDEAGSYDYICALHSSMTGTITVEEEEVATLAMEISSSAFANNATIPAKYTCDSDDVSPPLTFSNVPEDAESLVLITDDPDAPGGTWVHWTVWNIDPTTTEVDENTTPTDGVEGITDFEVNEYGGPCPPSGTHHYYFKLYALDTTLSIETSSTATDLETMMSAHILEEAELIGLYSS